MLLIMITGRRVHDPYHDCLLCVSHCAPSPKTEKKIVPQPPQSVPRKMMMIGIVCVTYPEYARDQVAVGWTYLPASSRRDEKGSALAGPIGIGSRGKVRIYFSNNFAQIPFLTLNHYDLDPFSKE